ncbi:MAG TPA: GNAT family N-acetyltransferase [Candidatus Obscuribacterales bacterium]
MNLSFRPACQSDLQAVVPLILAAEPDMLPFIYDTGKPGKNAASHGRPDTQGSEAFLSFAFSAGRGYFGYPLQTVGLDPGGQLLCCATAYKGQAYSRLVRETITLTLRFYGFWHSFTRIVPRALLLGKIYLPPRPDSLYLANVAVTADQRGQGLGRQLLEELHRQAQQQGLPRVELDVSLSNPRAQHFYESLGYHVEAEKAMEHPQIHGIRRMVRGS